jgi:hypothetical protein
MVVNHETKSRTLKKIRTKKESGFLGDVFFNGKGEEPNHFTIIDV